MEKAGYTRQAGEETHHIVAGTARRAAEARQVLDRFGIDINAAENGVFLAKTAHYATRENVYYDAVNGLLSSARTRDEVVQGLEYIRKGLLDGTFP